MGDRSAVGAGAREVFAQWWVSLDLLCVMGWIAIRTKTPSRLLVLGVTAALVFGVVLEVYDVFILRAFSRMPVLYSDTLLIWDGLNLAFDLVPGGVAGTLLSLALALSLTGYMIHRLLSKLIEGLMALRSKQAVVAISVLVACMAFERHPMHRDSLVQSSYSRLFDNIRRSGEMSEEMQRLAAEPASQTPKASMHGLGLEQTPDVFVLVVESYGAALLDEPILSGPYRQNMVTLQERLAESGYKTYSNRSRSPVVGGLSWQATSTILSGIQIGNQHIYSKLADTGAYGLPQFFSDHRYQTWTIQPGFRTRPGRPVSNPWGYQNTLYFEELNYHGERWGWGVVPDQYALGRGLQALHASPGGPNFLMFTGVSTHAPWDKIPEFRQDWESFGRNPEGTKDSSGVWRKLMSKLSGQKSSCVSLSCYQDAIEQEWLVLADFMEQVSSPAALFVVVGDHQPPIVSTQDSHVPIHFIARGVEGLPRLESIGFVEGMTAQDGQPVSHAGLFSLLVSLLESTDNELSKIYVADGVSPSGLLRNE